MDLEYIQRFVVLGKYLNFSQAAEILFISQPTLTRSINCLEKELNCTLFERTTKSVKLTHAGELFFPVASTMMNSYNNIKTILQAQNDTLLKIGYTGPVMGRRFAQWMDIFCSEYPDTKVLIQRYNPQQMNEAFYSHDIQLGILFKMNADKVPGISYKIISKEKFKIAVRYDHPLANRRHISIDEMANDKFLMCEREYAPNYYDKVTEIFKNRNFFPEISKASGQPSELCHLVEAGLGVAILSHYDSKSYGTSNVKFLEFGDDEDLNNAIVVAWYGRLSKEAERFKKILERYNE